MGVGVVRILPQRARVRLARLVAVGERERQLPDGLVLDGAEPFRRHLPGGFEALLRLCRIAARYPDQALGAERLHQVRLQLQRRFVLAVCLFCLADGVGDAALQIQVPRIVRVLGDRLVDRLVRLQQPVLSQVRARRARICGRRGAVLDGRLELPGGLVPLEPLQAEVAVRLVHEGGVRVQGDGLLISRLRALQIARGGGQPAPEHVRARLLAGVQRLADVRVEGPGEQLGSDLGIALPQADRGELHHGPRVLR